jgi:hypothetical protein
MLHPDRGRSLRWLTLAEFSDELAWRNGEAGAALETSQRPHHRNRRPQQSNSHALAVSPDQGVDRALVGLGLMLASSRSTSPT